MHNFGGLLIAMGLLSFVLPLFGRQFVLVKLFGGTTTTALVFIGAGVVLFVLGMIDKARSEAREESGARGPAGPAGPAGARASVGVGVGVDPAAPMGRCPNCRRFIALASPECPGCQASFGQGSAWKVEDLSPRRPELSPEAQAALREAIRRRAQLELELRDKVGECPNCRTVIPMLSQECPKCQALFGPGSAWKLKAL